MLGFVDIVMDFLASNGQPLAWLGMFYLAKLSTNLLCDLYDGVTAYILPILWRRDLSSEFGPWALVTGCSRGIGKEYVLSLARRGVSVVMAARDKAALEKLAQEVEGLGVKSKVVVVDFLQENAVEKVIKQVKDLEVGILVNNVGILGPHFQPYLDMEYKLLEGMIRVNVLTTSQLCHALIPSMVSRGRGAVVNIASIMAYQPVPYCSLYAATKYFVQGLTLSLAEELKGTGVVVQEVDPGHVLTGMTQDVYPATPAPLPSTFASHAVSTIGHSSHTCGWWGHSLFTVLTSWLVSPRLLPSMMRVMGRLEWKYATYGNDKTE